MRHLAQTFDADALTAHWSYFLPKASSQSAPATVVAAVVADGWPTKPVTRRRQSPSFPPPPGRRAHKSSWTSSKVAPRKMPWIGSKQVQGVMPLLPAASLTTRSSGKPSALSGYAWTAKSRRFWRKLRQEPTPPEPEAVRSTATRLFGEKRRRERILFFLSISPSAGVVGPGCTLVLGFGCFKHAWCEV